MASLTMCRYFSGRTPILSATDFLRATILVALLRRTSIATVSLTLRWRISTQTTSRYSSGVGKASFSSAGNFVVGSGPVALVLADFDGDLIEDIATANSRSDSISVLLGRGDGVFVTSQQLPLPAWSLVVEDFDGDAVPDLAAAIRDSEEIAVLIGKGDGTFSTASSFPAGLEPDALVARDLNGDARPDLVTGHSEALSVLLGNVDGTFQRGQLFEVGTDLRHLASGDFDRDGSPDLVAVSPQLDEILLLFAKPTPASSSDCNRNGIPDLCDIQNGTSSDANQNGIPDECQSRFRRGDPDANGTINVSDPIKILFYLFRGDVELPCHKSGDVDDNGELEAADAVQLLTFLFLGGRPPEEPRTDCGVDPMQDQLACDYYPECEM